MQWIQCSEMKLMPTETFHQKETYSKDSTPGQDHVFKNVKDTMKQQKGQIETWDSNATK